jgi:chromosome segregation ATPase
MTHGTEDRVRGADPGQRAMPAGFLEGQIEVLRTQLAGFEAADEHHRAELVAARAEAAEAQATLRESQARLDDRLQLIADLRSQLEATRAALARAERERAAVIEALGWRAKRRLTRPS